MKVLHAASVVLSLALLSAVIAAPVRADEFDRKTIVTFSGPVEIPGSHLTGWGVLPAGTYVFKILSSQTDRHIVQIFNADETQIYATVLAIPNYRLKTTDKTVITFAERTAGEPEALRAWFYPGRNWGEEFVYPKDKAMALAKRANTPVLFSETEIPSEVTAPGFATDAPVVESMRRTPVSAYQPTGQQVAMAEVVTAPPADVADPQPTVADAKATDTKATDTNAMDTNKTDAPALPATGSTLPLIGLLGLVAMGAALALRGFSKQA